MTAVLVFWQLALNDDCSDGVSSGTVVYSCMQIPVIADVEYAASVAGINGARGSVAIAASLLPRPGNDDFAK